MGEEEVDRKRAKRDAFLEYLFQEDGVYAVYHPPVGRGRALELDALQMELLEKGFSSATEKTILELFRNQGKPVKVGAPLPEEQKRDATFTVSVAPSEMEAYVDYVPAFGGQELQRADFEKKLKEAGVLFGVREEALALLASERRSQEHLLIAEGERTEDGEPAQMNYLIAFERRNLKPKELEDGRVDYREVSTLFYVEAGNPLARKVPATSGKDGKTVTGKPIKARPGKDFVIPLGKGVQLAEGDPNLVVAAEAGYPALSGKKVSVLPLYRVEKDVDFATGNIYFTGNVEVRGSVRPGFRVIAQGNIEVNGSVEEGSLEAEGDVLVRGGIIGRKKSVIRAGGKVLARFVEQAQIVATGEVKIGEEIFHSEVLSGESVVLEGRHGRVAGGKVMAKSRIAAKVLGNHFATETHLFVGRDPRLALEREKTAESIEKTKRALEEVGTAIKGYHKKTKVLPSEDSEEGRVLLRLQRTKHQLQARLRKALENFKALTEDESVEKKGRVECSGNCFPGVRVHILDFHYEVYEELQRPLFFLGEEKIEVSLAQGEKKGARKETERAAGEGSVVE